MIPAFLVSVIGGSVVMAWLFNRSNGGLLPIPLLHATVNTIGAGYVFPMFSGAQNTKLWWIYSLLWALTAIVLVGVSPAMRQGPAHS